MVERYTVYGALCSIELGIFSVVLAPNLNIVLLRNTYHTSSLELKGLVRNLKISISKLVNMFVRFHSCLLQYLSFVF
jgi:hypothetical protein